MNNILLFIIIVLIIVYICKENYMINKKENFESNVKKIDYSLFNDYLNNKNVNTIFPLNFEENLKSKDSVIDKDLVYLYKLSKKIEDIYNFGFKDFMKLIKPFKQNGVEINFGIFNSYDIYTNIETLYNKRNNLELSDIQIKSINIYFNKMKTIKKINEILEIKEVNFMNCEKIIERFFKINNFNSELAKEFSFDKLNSKQLNLMDFKLKELESLLSSLIKIPDNPCAVFKLIFEINDLKKKLSNKDFKNCNKNLEKYIKDMYIHHNVQINKDKNILQDDYLDLNMNDLNKIKSFYKYSGSCANIQKINDLKNKNVINEKLNENKINYFNELKKILNEKMKSKEQLKKCLNISKKYIKNKMEHEDLPLYNLTKIENCSEEHLEKIVEIYDNLDSCESLPKENLIMIILNKFKSIKKLNGDTYGCSNHIIKYVLQKCEQKNIMLKTEDLDFSKPDKLRKLDTNILETILDSLKVTPPCSDLTNKGEQKFDNRLHDFFNTQQNNDSSDRNLELDTSYSNNVTYHPINYKPLMSDDKEMNLDRFIRQGDNLFDMESRYFNRQEKQNNLQNLDKCLTDFIKQENLKGIGNIYMPTIEIEGDKEKILKNIK